jgi:hypothetical protein
MVQNAEAEMMQSRLTWPSVSLVKARTVSLTLGLLALLPFGWTGAAAQEPRAASAQQLVAQTIANELSGGIGVYFSYLATDRETGISKTKEVVETPEGNLSRSPLTASP